MKCNLCNAELEKSGSFWVSNNGFITCTALTDAGQQQNHKPAEPANYELAGRNIDRATNCHSLEMETARKPCVCGIGETCSNCRPEAGGGMMYVNSEPIYIPRPACDCGEVSE